MCTSEYCVSLAGTIIDKMDSVAQPCEDFYKYACGGFEQNQFLPPADGVIDTPLLLNEDTQKTLFQVAACHADLRA